MKFVVDTDTDTLNYAEGVDTVVIDEVGRLAILDEDGLLIAVFNKWNFFTQMDDAA